MSSELPPVSVSSGSKTGAVGSPAPQSKTEGPTEEELKKSEFKEHEKCAEGGWTATVLDAAKIEYGDVVEMKVLTKEGKPFYGDSAELGYEVHKAPSDGDKDRQVAKIPMRLLIRTKDGWQKIDKYVYTNLEVPPKDMDKFKAEMATIMRYGEMGDKLLFGMKEDASIEGGFKGKINKKNYEDAKTDKVFKFTMEKIKGQKEIRKKTKELKKDHTGFVLDLSQGGDTKKVKEALAVTDLSKSKFSKMISKKYSTFHGKEIQVKCLGDGEKKFRTAKGNVEAAVDKKDTKMTEVLSGIIEKDKQIMAYQELHEAKAGFEKIDAMRKEVEGLVAETEKKCNHKELLKGAKDEVAKHLGDKSKLKEILQHYKGLIEPEKTAKKNLDDGLEKLREQYKVVHERIGAVTLLVEQGTVQLDGDQKKILEDLKQTEKKLAEEMVALNKQLALFVEEDKQVKPFKEVEDAAQKIEEFEKKAQAKAAEEAKKKAAEEEAKKEEAEKSKQVPQPAADPVADPLASATTGVQLVATKTEPKLPVADAAQPATATKAETETVSKVPPVPTFPVPNPPVVATVPKPPVSPPPL